MKLVLTALLFISTVASAQAFAGETPSACQVKAVDASYKALGIANDKSTTSGLDTGSAVIVTIYSSSLVSQTNPAGQADVTVYTPSRSGDDCEVGGVVVAIYDTNG